MQIDTKQDIILPVNNNSLKRIDVEEGIHLEIACQDHVTQYHDVLVKNKDFLYASIPYLKDFDLEKAKSQCINFENEFKLGTKYRYFIMKDNQLVGSVLLNIRSPGIGGIGYWLAVDMIGQGLVTKCSKELMKLGFNQLNLEKLIISTAETNEKSQNVAKRLGFEFERISDTPHQIHDVQYFYQEYTITKERYQKMTESQQDVKKSQTQ